MESVAQMDTTTGGRAPKRLATEIESPDKSKEQDSKKKRFDESCICPICEDMIVDSSEVEDNEGLDSESLDIVYCQGSCETWLHRQCAGLSKAKYQYLLKSDKPYHCPHCKLEFYDTLVKSMEAKISALELKVLSLSSHAATSSKSIDTNSSVPNPTNTKPSEPDTQISSIVTSYINEEKEKSRRRLNLIVHNFSESKADDGPSRKQEDISAVSSVFKKHLGISATITNAFRLGKKGTKPRLLKITVASDMEKGQILRNCTKLRSANNPEEVKKVFITPDLTPKEQAINKSLRTELKNLNKDGKVYQIKNGKIVRRKT